jgi:DNA-binding MarR family transcriptional regulator
MTGRSRKLSTKQQDALAAVAAVFGRTADDIASEIGTSPQGAAQTLASLVRAGLVKRVRRPGSRRVSYWPAQEVAA